MKIELYYNPYFGKTTLVIDGVTYRNKHGRLYDYLLQTIEQWLHKKNEPYRSWNGFFIELTEEVNEDDYEFVFNGNHEDFELIEKAFREQAQIIRERGYDSDRIVLKEKNIYDNSDLKERLCLFINRYQNAYKDQDYYNGMSDILNEVQALDVSDDASFRDIYDRLQALIEYAKEKSIDKAYWDDLLQDLDFIYKKAG